MINISYFGSESNILMNKYFWKSITSKKVYDVTLESSFSIVNGVRLLIMCFHIILIFNIFVFIIPQLTVYIFHWRQTVLSAFRIVSDDTAFAISGMMPVDILSDDMMSIHHSRWKDRKGWGCITRWQKGRWTYCLILFIGEWLQRERGEINYSFDQFLIGPGGYLYGLKLDISPESSNCDEVAEDQLTYFA